MVLSSPLLQSPATAGQATAIGPCAFKTDAGLSASESWLQGSAVGTLSSTPATAPDRHPWNHTNGGSGCDCEANEVPAHGGAGGSTAAATWRGGSFDGSCGALDQLRRSGWSNGGWKQLSSPQTAGQPVVGSLASQAAEAWPGVQQGASGQALPLQQWSNMTFTSSGSGTAACGGAQVSESCRTFDQRWGDNMDEQQQMQPAVEAAAVVQSASPHFAARESWRMLI